MAYAITVSSSAARPTHDIKLTYSGTSVGLVLCDGKGDHDPTRIQRDPYPQSALKIYTGSQKYSDYEFPWTPISQTDWIGGRGLEDFDEDSTRFFDSKRAITWTPGRILSGPLHVYTTGYRGQSIIWPYKTAGTNYAAQDITATVGGSPGSTYVRPFASKFTTGAAFVPKYAYGVMRLTGSFGGSNAPRITAKIWSHDSGNDRPDTVIASGYTDVYTNEEDNNSTNPWLDFRVTLTLVAPTTTLAATTTYWISFQSVSTIDPTATRPDVDILSHIYGTRGCTGLEGVGGTITWTVCDTATTSAYVRVTDEEKPFIAHFFEFKDSLHAALQFEDGTASKVYINGDQGVASAGAATSITIDTAGGKLPTAIHYETGTWTADEWIGSVVKLTKGDGSDAMDVSQAITDNDTTSLTVADWDINPGASTEFAIVGSDKWTAIGELGTNKHGWTKMVKDVLSIREIAYFTMGTVAGTADYYLKRMRRWADSGTWTVEWVAETGNNADLITAIPAISTSSGVRTAVTEIWIAVNNKPTGIWYATSVDGSGTGIVADLSFTGQIPVGDTYERFSKLLKYGETARLWAVKRGSLWEVIDKIPYEVPMSGMTPVSDERNGLAAIAHDVYLYFSMHDGVERLYANNLDDIGPNRDAGFARASDRGGNIADLVSYPGRLFAAVDGGDFGISCVLAYNNYGWHEIFRAPYEGQRIRSLYVQSIPGDAPERLWIQCGSDIVWVPLAINTTQVYPNYYYTWESEVITSMMDFGQADVDKYFNTVKIVGSGTGYVDYRTDTSYGEWGALGAWSGTTELTVAATGKRIQFRIRLTTTSNIAYSEINAVVVEGIMRPQVKFFDTVTFRLSDYSYDMNGDYDGQVPSTVMTRLESWANMAYPVTMYAVNSRFDNKSVFVEPHSLRVLRTTYEEDKATYICQMRLLEVS